jgi:hypothetical protein
VQGGKKQTILRTNEGRNLQGRGKIGMEEYRDDEALVDELIYHINWSHEYDRVGMDSLAEIEQDKVSVLKARLLSRLKGESVVPTEPGKHIMTNLIDIINCPGYCDKQQREMRGCNKLIINQHISSCLPCAIKHGAKFRKEPMP